MKFTIPTAFERVNKKPARGASKAEGQTGQTGQSGQDNRANQASQPDTDSNVVELSPLEMEMDRLAKFEQEQERVKQVREEEQRRKFEQGLEQVEKWIRTKQESTGFSRLVTLGMWFDSQEEKELEQDVRIQIRKFHGVDSHISVSSTVSDDLYLKRMPRTKEIYFNKLYGRLTGMHAVAHDHHGALMIKLRCDCGRERVARLGDVKAGRVTCCVHCQGGDSLLRTKMNTMKAIMAESIQNHLSERHAVERAKATKLSGVNSESISETKATKLPTTPNFESNPSKDESNDSE